MKQKCLVVYIIDSSNDNTYNVAVGLSKSPIAFMYLDRISQAIKEQQEELGCNSLVLKSISCHSACAVSAGRVMVCS